jgi:hypothetical protein
MLPSTTGTQSRLPLRFLFTGILMFVLFQIFSVVTFAGWTGLSPRNPEGWSSAHLMLLGWGTMIAMGAVYQLIFVVVQRSIYSERLGKWQYAVFLTGVLGLTYGFYQGDVRLIAGFATLAFAGIALFVFNIAATLFLAKIWNAVTRSALRAVLSLFLTGATGLGMGLNFRFGFLGMEHNQWFGAHLWFGLAGWFGLLITGFSYKMLPMFYLSHGYPEKPQNYVLALWNAAVWTGAISSLLGLPRWMQLAAFLFLAGALAVYCRQIVLIARKKHKKTPGFGILVAVWSTFVLAGAAAAFVLYAAWRPAALVEETGYAFVISVYLWIWVVPVILGYMSKIVPFLWWTIKYGDKVGKEKTPLMADLISDRLVQVMLTLWLVAAFALLGATASGSDLAVKAAACVWSVLSLVYMGLIGRVFTK